MGLILTKEKQILNDRALKDSVMANSPMKDINRRYKVIKRLARKRFTRLELANRELKTIYELGNQAITSLDVDEVLNSITNTIPKLLKVSGCYVRVFDEASGKLRLEAAHGLSKKFKEVAYSISIGDGTSGRVAETRLPIVIADILADKRVKFQKECTDEGMRSLLAVPIIFKNDFLGVIVAFSAQARYFAKSELALLSTFAVHAAIALNNARAYRETYWNYYNTVVTLVKAMEAKDSYTRGHSERVTGYGVKLAQKISMPADDIQLLIYAGKLHDIGKIAIPDFILNKLTSLTLSEKVEIQAHAVKGVEIVKPLKFLKKCLPAIRHHHERYDGKGYPDGLKGRKIPFLARILCIADAFDAMISNRPYRKALSAPEAINEIKRNSRTQFDPELAENFMELLQEQPGLQYPNKIITSPSICLAV